MKKLITLLLVLCGGISQASGKTIYFINNWNLSGLKFCTWTDGGGNTGDMNFPDITSYIGKNDGWFNCYALDLGDYEKFIIKHDVNDNRTETITKNTAEFSDGEYCEFNWDGSENVKTATLYTFNFNVTTAEAWDNMNIYLFTGSDCNITGRGWPGLAMLGSGTNYSYSFKSYTSDVKVVFNKGSESAQTCNMTSAEGDNLYYIASVVNSQQNNSWGTSVKTNASGYSTFVHWNSLTIPAGIAYTAEDNNNGSATAHNVTNPQGNVPMLIHGNANTTYHFAAAASGISLAYSNAFQAGDGNTVAKSVGGKYNYLLNGATFKAANGTNKVVEGKAYLQLSQEATGASRILIFDEDSETTGIRLVDYEQQTGDDCYNLQGIKVASPTKGVYLRNGKKFIVK